MNKIDQTKFYIGLDMHPEKTQYAVRRWDGEIVSEGSCATRAQDLKDRISPYLFSCMVGAEATTCFYPVRNKFLEEKILFKVANVHQIRKLVAKSDKLDARRLSDMLRLNTFPESYIPGKEIQELRDLVTLRHGILEDRIAAQNRLWAAVTKAGICMVWRSMFSKKGLIVLKKAISDGMLHAEGPILLSHYEQCQDLLEKATRTLTENVKTKFPKEWTAIQEVEGIGPILASYLIPEIHPITRFANQKKLRRYAGIIPCFQESAGKVYSNVLPKTSSRSRLRWALTQAAHHAVRKKNSPLQAYYNNKKRTKPKQKALVIVARIICDKIYLKLMGVKN